MKILNKNDEIITTIDYKNISDEILTKVLEKQSENFDIQELQFEISNQYGEFIFIITSITIVNPNIDVIMKINSPY
jgi:hypothetical protein